PTLGRGRRQATHLAESLPEEHRLSRDEEIRRVDHRSLPILSAAWPDVGERPTQNNGKNPRAYPYRARGARRGEIVSLLSPGLWPGGSLSRGWLHSGADSR